VRSQISKLRFQISDRFVLKNRWRQREQCSEHTSRHTSPEDGDLADSRKGPRSSSDLKAPCLHLSQIGISIVKKLKERALSLQGKLPAPSILREFALRFGSGSPLPLIIA
jgi:hypothetical protein